MGGADGLKAKREVRARMGLMVDRPTHYSLMHLTGRANAYFFARAYGMEEAKAEGGIARAFSDTSILRSMRMIGSRRIRTV